MAVVASGQVGGNPHLRILWGCAMEHESGCQARCRGPRIPLEGNTATWNSNAAFQRDLCLDFSGDGKLVLCWNRRLSCRGNMGLATGRALDNREGHNAPVFAIHFNPFSSTVSLICGMVSQFPSLAKHLTWTCPILLVSCGQKHINFDASANTRPEISGPEHIVARIFQSMGASARKKGEAAKAPMIWRLEGNAPQSSKGDTVQDFTAIAFVNDTEPIRTRDTRTGELVLLMGGLRAPMNNGRVHVAELSVGPLRAIYTFTRSHGPYILTLKTSPMTSRFEDLNEPPAPPWWEIPDPLTEPSATIRWGPTAILVHAIPRDVTRAIAPPWSKRQRELETVRHKLKVKPNDQELLGRLQKLSYSGLVGHAGGVQQFWLW